MRLRTFAMVLVALLILTNGRAVWSQTVQGVITGTITDPTGAVVPNATVTITNVGTNISQATTTGSDGSYRFPLVPPGTYTVEIKAASFTTVRVSGIVVEASQVIPLNRQLELARAQQVIEVTEQAPLVQTATSDLGFQVDSSTIEHAALVDRDVFDVLPFMAPQVSLGLAGMAASGGARSSGTSYMLNGAEDNNNFSEGALNINPPLESVEDFALITNSMSAQYGRGGGAVVSASQKSGTNKFHGSLYEQNRNASLNANDFFFNKNGNTGKPKYIKNQYGGSIGGPIRKDKTFFFFTLDRLKLLQAITPAQTFVPTTAALNYVKTHGGTLAQQILGLPGYTPATSDAPCSGQENITGGPSSLNNNGINAADGLPWATGCLASFSDPQTTTTNSYYGRVDQNFSNSDRLSFSANVSRFLFVDKFGGNRFQTPFANNGNIPATTTQNQHNLALSETHTFSPRLFNEVTISHNRFFNPVVEGDPSKQTAPEIYIDNQSQGCNNYAFGPQEGVQIQAFTQDRWALQDNVSWNLGRHALKFGGSGNYGILYRNWDLGLPGQYEFGNLTSVTGTCPSCTVITPASDGTLQPDGTIAKVTSEANASFAGDYPYFEETSINPQIPAPNKANAYRHYTSHDYAAFVQDDWKMTSRLTLNLGLRWERFGAPAEDHGILAQFTNLTCNLTDPACVAAARVGPVSRMWNTNNHDFGPRVGFAWDPFGKGKMAVRGSYGIYYDRIFDNIWSNGAWNPPFYALLDFQADRGDAIFYSNPASIGGAYNPNGPNGPIPYPGKRVSVRTMDVNMKDTSGQNYYFGVERQFLGGLLLRGSYQGSMGRHLPVLLNLNRFDGIGYNATLAPALPNALYSGFNYRSNSVSSNYNSLVLEAQKHMGHGLEFQAGYTYSKLLDVDSELFSGCYTIGGYTAPHYFITNANKKLDYGRGAEDHRHAFKFSTTYELPFLKSQRGFVGHALGGWSIGSFFQLYTGHPINVWNGRTRVRARTRVAAGGIEPNGSTCVPTPPATTCNALVFDQNNIPFNIGGDYNLDGVGNDRPAFLGSSLGSVYSGNNPADGIFTDNHLIGCGEAGLPSAWPLSNAFGGSCPPAGTTVNALFGNPAYPSGATPYERFGTLGRDVFVGPKLVNVDLGLHKTFKVTESVNLRFSAEAQDLANHPNFDCIQGNLSKATFGKAQCLVGQVTNGIQSSRVMSLSLRLSF